MIASLLASVPPVDPSRWPDAVVFSVALLAIAWIATTLIKSRGPIK